jgi:hypothetical protein
VELLQVALVEILQFLLVLDQRLVVTLWFVLAAALRPQVAVRLCYLVPARIPGRCMWALPTRALRV